MFTTGPYLFYKTIEYQVWLQEQPLKTRVQVEDRLSNIELHNHFGFCKKIDDVIWELKWACGRRLYFAYIPPQKIILLLGGNKNGQNQDIKKAKNIAKKCVAN